MEVESIMQWHPAFCSAIELELREDKRILEYEREHNLGKMPLRVDLLVIKKEPGQTIKNEIGKFFRGNNILEYKSPDDGVNIDTFYKVLSYACLYKAETGKVDEIQDTDITISLIREGKPEKLLRQLSAKYVVEEAGRGIYRVDRMLFPLQIVTTRELDPESHVWLKALTRSLKPEEAKRLVDTFAGLKDKDDRLNAQAVFDLATDANEYLFQQMLEGDGRMTEAIKRMVAPELVALLSQKDAAILDAQEQLAGKDEIIAGKDVEIAGKDVEIALLKKQLAEAMKKK